MTLFLDGRTDSQRLINYKNNAKIDYKIIFCNNLSDEEKQKEFENILEDIDKSTILVFKQKTFKDITNDIIHKNDRRIYNYVVVPEGMPITLGDKILISIFRKLKICKQKVKKIYKRELDRILPNINIANIKNYTNDKRFKDIESLFNK